MMSVGLVVCDSGLPHAFITKACSSDTTNKHAYIHTHTHVQIHAQCTQRKGIETNKRKKKTMNKFMYGLSRIYR